LTKLEGPELLNLLISVDVLSLQSLISQIEEYLIKNQFEFLQKNPTEILELIHQHESFTKLWNFYLEKIREDPKSLFDSDKFISIKASLLELLLQQEDLHLEEIVIWDNLIKWGLAQNPSIPKDVDKWSKEETTIMEKTLHSYIPLVRFYCMSSEEFLDKVYPFKELLPKDSINNLLAFYLSPNRLKSDSTLKFDSIIVEPQHFAIFSSWIDKKDELYYDVINMPYSFNLLFRASNDGMTSEAFHEKCDYKRATIVIAKIQYSEQIVGGYNPLYWDQSHNYKTSNDSFIFSFVNRTNIYTAKVGHINHEQSRYSVLGYPHGFQFGYHGALTCHNGSWYGFTSPSYPKVGIPIQQFNIDDFEIFQVIKK